jgi:hypothetical protein
MIGVYDKSGLGGIKSSEVRCDVELGGGGGGGEVEGEKGK